MEDGMDKLLHFKLPIFSSSIVYLPERPAVLLFMHVLNAFQEAAGTEGVVQPRQMWTELELALNCIMQKILYSVKA